jgi:EPS-associated MarR family transcriptional regulator
MSHSVTDEVRYRMLRYLEEHPNASQRELAQHLGVSVGKVNYCLKALITKGLVKMRNFQGSKRKLAYAYYLTRQGIEEKVNVTYRFLRLKTAEYDAISAEIERLTNELADAGLLDSEKVEVQ